MTFSKCTVCFKNLPLTAYRQQFRGDKIYISKQCKKCVSQKIYTRIKERRITDPEFKAKEQKAITKYHYKKRLEDPLFRFKHNLKSLIYQSFKSRTLTKNLKSTEILGCSIPFLISHLSSKFKKGMTLENHGKWHIDHIIPLSSAKTKKDVIRLNHYTNLQPLWAKDNILKGNKQ